MGLDMYAYVAQKAGQHNEFYEGNAGFAIRLRTFAASIVNGNLGSIPVI